MPHSLFDQHRYTIDYSISQRLPRICLLMTLDFDYVYTRTRWTRANLLCMRAAETCHPPSSLSCRVCIL